MMIYGFCNDIEEFCKWSWNKTLETSASFLTGTGYEELYSIGKRIQEKYPQLLNGTPDNFYFRPTDEQRTITSAVAFVHGLTDGTTLDLVIDNARKQDEVARPYEICAKYEEDKLTSHIVTDQIAEFTGTSEYIDVQARVQKRLGIITQLSAEDIFNLYEICRFHRSWTSTKQSPWCAAFSDEDLVVLEYRDDIRHYYKNGYGLWMNERLGAMATRNLYETFLASVEGVGRSFVSYFTHDTMLDMVFCALGMYKDAKPLLGTTRNASRLWRTSYLASFSNNLMAVLYRCQISETQTHKVQFFHNERLTELCPENGCTWEEFKEKFQPFANATLDFCSLDYPNPASKIDQQFLAGGALTPRGIFWLVLIELLVVWLWRL